MSDWMTPAEVGQMVGVSKQAISQRCLQGHIRTRREGGRVKIHAEDARIWRDMREYGETLIDGDVYVNMMTAFERMDIPYKRLHRMVQSGRLDVKRDGGGRPLVGLAALREELEGPLRRGGVRTVQSAADDLGQTSQWVYRWIYSGKIKPARHRKANGHM